MSSRVNLTWKLPKKIQAWPWLLVARVCWPAMLCTATVKHSVLVTFACLMIALPRPVVFVDVCSWSGRNLCSAWDAVLVVQCMVPSDRKLFLEGEQWHLSRWTLSEKKVSFRSQLGICICCGLAFGGRAVTSSL